MALLKDVRMPILVLRTKEFLLWFENLNTKDQLQIDTRVHLIQEYGHFGDAKNLGNGLAELRWKNGRRVYFTKIDSLVILLLVGGLKNAQKKDIKKARVLIEKYVDSKA